MADSPLPLPRSRTVAACLLLATTVLTAGCVGSTGAGTGTEATPAAASDRTATAASTATPDGGGSLESRLADLAAADEPAAFAAAHGIDYDDGRVSVVVTLREGATLPDGHDATVDLAVDGTVQASVPVDELRALAAADNVTYVRTPREPST